MKVAQLIGNIAQLSFYFVGYNVPAFQNHDGGKNNPKMY